MKKPILFSFYILLSISQAKAQNLPNPSFDSVYIGGIDRIFQWITSDGFMIRAGTFGDTIPSLMPRASYSAEGFQFSELVNGLSIIFTAPDHMGIRLRTMPNLKKENGLPYETFLLNGDHLKTDGEGYIDISSCGSPFPYRPNALIGMYQFIDTLSLIENFAKCQILLKKYNASTNKIDTIAFTESNFHLNPSSSWKPFSIPIDYRSDEVPDSIVVVFHPSIYPNSESELWLDDLSFEFSTNSTRKILDLDNLPTIYPNPNMGLLHIDTKGQFYTYYRILDVQGKVLKEGTFMEQIPIIEIPDQVLLLQLINENGALKPLRIIKQK